MTAWAEAAVEMEAGFHASVDPALCTASVAPLVGSRNRCSISAHNVYRRDRTSDWCRGWPLVAAIGASLTPTHAASINAFMRPCDAYAHRAMPMRNSDVEYKDGSF